MEESGCKSVCVEETVGTWTCYQKCPVDATAAVAPIGAAPASTTNTHAIDGVRYRTSASTQAESHSRHGAHNLATGFDF